MRIIHEGTARAWEHHHPFDPTYGYDRDALLAVAPPATEPDDFDAFWQQTFDENQAIPLDYELLPIEINEPEINVFRVIYRSWGGRRTQAWLIEPKHTVPAAGVVIGHGYGGRANHIAERVPVDGPDERDVVRIYPVARGFNISATDDLPLNDSSRHVVHGIESKETYIIRGCVAELWTCATVLLDRHPQLAGHLAYSGSSFGGGLGALMLPWDRRFVAANLGVPTFGHHPIRLQCPCVGSGEAVRRYHAAHPEVAEVLRYYDAATAAGKITIPVLAAAALFDPAVPPPGQFAVCNALAGECLLHIQSVGHYSHPDVPDDAQLLSESVGSFLRHHTCGGDARG